MAKRSLLLLGCTLLGGLLWVLVSGGNGAPPPADAVDAGAQAATTGGLLTGAGAGAVEESADVPREGAGPQRSVVDTGEAATPDFELVKVKVVRKESGEPVAGATVWYHGTIDRTGWSEEQQAEYQQTIRDREVRATKYGRVSTADEGGVVLLPIDNRLYLSARSGSLYGELTFGRRSGEKPIDQVVELEEDRTFVVRVIDANGLPAVGVPIIGRAQGRPLPRSGRFELGTSTDPHGEAKAAHLQMDVGRKVNLGGLVAEYRLQAMIPGNREYGAIFDPRREDVNSMTLQLPPTGSLVVRGRDADGNPAQLQSVVLSPVLEDEPEELREYTNLWNPVSLEDNQALFPWVVPGRRMNVRASVDGLSVQQIINGPTFPGEVVTVAVGPAPSAIQVVGRILDASGAPVPGHRFRLQCLLVDGKTLSRSLTTDESGGFRVMWTEDAPLAVAELTLQEQVSSGMDHSMRWFRAENVSFTAGTNPLGDMTWSFMKRRSL